MQEQRRSIFLILTMLSFVTNQFFGVFAMPNQLQDEFTNLKHLISQQYLTGFTRAISGQNFDYHSPHPDVRAALLSRATDGKMAVSWETESLPSSYQEPFATFIWIAGLGSNIAEKKFDLFINDEYSLTFTSSPEKNWTIKGLNEVELSFKTMMVDQYTDLFGYMFLKVPAKILAAGKSIKLKVVGEAAGSNAWFMVFQERLEPMIDFQPEMILLKNKNRLLQNVRINIVNLNKPLWAHIYSKDQAIDVTLNFGFNSVTLPFDAVKQEKEVDIYIEMKEQTVVRKRFLLQPVRKFVVHLLSHSHLDIGYTHRQDDVLKLQFQHLENAVEIAAKSQKYPPEAQFKWNTEQMWHVDEYFRQKSIEKKERMLDAIRKGWIGLDALYANILTGLCRSEELMETVAAARSLSKKYGLKIESAMITDIPGWTWGLIPALAQSGIKYLSLGPNMGHRIGYVFDWADQPFYWVSPSGEEKILCWVHGKGYSWFHTGLEYVFTGNLDVSRAKFERIFPYLEELAQSNYPYELVGLRYSIGSDNGPPDPDLPEMVNQWNQKYESPKLIISTTAELFHEFEKKYGHQIPEVRGDFTPYWEDGAASTARETAINRAAAERLIQASILWTMIDPKNYPHQQFEDAWREVLLFSEHTWGAWNSISAPEEEFVKSQWRWKEQRALKAEHLSKELVERAFQSIAAKDEKIQSIDVFNTNSWDRTDLVILPASMNLLGDLVKDEAGKKVLSQRLSTGELVFLANDVPALRSKRFMIHKGKPYQKGKASIKENRISNGVVTMEINPNTGAISSLKLEEINHNFVDGSELAGLNNYVYVEGRDPKNKRSIEEPIKLVPKETGRLVASIIIESSAPGSNRLSREIRLIHGIPRVEIINELDRPLIREPEAIHFAFPFNIPSGEIRVNSPWAVVQPEKDQVKGACKNWFTVQHWVDVSNENFGITWSPIDAPLMEIGNIRADATVSGWVRKLEPSQTIYSYVMNNYWETNYKADQPGVTHFQYSIFLHKKYDQIKAEQFGIEQSQPLIPMVVSKDKPLINSLFSIEPRDVVVTMIKPVDDRKKILIRLFNTSDDEKSVKFNWGSLQPKEVYFSNLFEKPIERLGDSISMPGYGIRTLLLIQP
jgi:alpha-mannosidase